MPDTEYFLELLRTGQILQALVLRRLFTIPLEHKNGPVLADYVIYVKGNERYINIDGNPVKIETKRPITEPLFNVDQIIVTKGLIPEIPDNEEARLGTLIKFRVINIEALNNKIPWDNTSKSIRWYEGIIAEHLQKENPDPDKHITVAERKKFARMCIYLETLSTVIVTSLTPRVISRPPGLDAERKRLAEKYDLTNPADQVKYENALKAFDRAYLEGDPTLDVVFGKKTLQRRAKLVLGFGSEESLVGTSKYIVESLADGLPRDAETTKTYLDVSRAGSINRGNNVQIGGVIFKVISAVTAGIKILKNDCGSNELRKVTVTKDNLALFSNRYTVRKGKVELLGDVKPGVYEIRTPLYCKTEKPHYCERCCGKAMGSTEDGIIDAGGDVSRVIIGFYMSAMHGRTNDNYEVKDIDFFF